jgi:hypothetical protein
MVNLKKVGKSLLGALAIVSVTNSLSIPLTAYVNSKIPQGNNTIVFTSGYDPLNKLPERVVSGFIDYFMYTPVTLRQNLKGCQVDWISNSNKEEIISRIKNPIYENLVFIGHGSKSSYAATDCSLDSNDLIKIYRDLPYRKGEFIMHTCGEDEERVLLKQVLFEPRIEDKGYDFDRTIDPVTNYLKAVSELGKTLIKKL